MTFHPRMQSSIEGITVVGGLHTRAWNGFITDVWSVECLEGSGGEYVSHAPRLVIIYDKTGEGGIDVLGQLSCQRHRKEGFRNPISYVPAGMRVWSRVEKLSALRHLDIHLDRDALLRRFGNGLDAQKLDTPRLMFSDDRIMALARLIAGECLDPGGFGDLYGEGLVTAVLGLLFGIDRSSATGKLPARQLRKVLDYIEANCVHSIRLQDLADLAGLSPSYFSAAFKASTGVPPLKWQMQARIERVKTLMRQSPISLTEAAAMSGFADQAHLTRTFKALVGSTPAAWRRNNVR